VSIRKVHGGGKGKLPRVKKVGCVKKWGSGGGACRGEVRKIQEKKRARRPEEICPPGGREGHNTMGKKEKLGRGGPAEEGSLLLLSNRGGKCRKLQNSRKLTPLQPLELGRGGVR